MGGEHGVVAWNCWTTRSDKREALRSAKLTHSEGTPIFVASNWAECVVCPGVERRARAPRGVAIVSRCSRSFLSNFHGAPGEH